MKKRIITLTIVLFGSVLNINAQNFTGYDIINAWGQAMVFNNTDYIKIKVGGILMPRISGKNNCIVFYDSETSAWNDIQVGQVFLKSDEKLKTDITAIDQGLSKVLSLRPVSYKWKNSDLKSSSQEANGFIAQEVKNVIPEAVKESETGDLLIDYNSITPYLVQSICELQNQIDDLRLQLEEKADRSDLLSATSVASITLNKANLGQNSPNPFSDFTSIDFYIPDNAITADIAIYTIQGKLQKNYSLAERGNGKLNLNSSEFEKGMYFYSLIVDGKIISTKRMLVTN